MDKDSIKTTDNQLPIKQERFCSEFVRLGNATQAYKLAGYADTPSANANVHKLLRKDSVRQCISELRADLTVKQGITRESEAKEYSIVIEMCKQTGDARLLLKALDSRCKLFGLLIDRGITTDTNQERELDAAEQQEAKRLAILMLNQKYGKEGKVG